MAKSPIGKRYNSSLLGMEANGKRVKLRMPNFITVKFAYILLYYHILSKLIYLYMLVYFLLYACQIYLYKQSIVDQAPRPFEHRSLRMSHRSFTQDARENPIVGEVAKNLTEKSIAKERTAVDTGSATRVHARKGGDVKVERILNREIV